MHRNFREKRTVYYFRYRFRVGGTDYTGKVRKTENLMTARIGDSVVVRYRRTIPTYIAWSAAKTANTG